ncbi:MAG TPA: hypothetical protein VF109_02055 [Mycobacteriales bacterium]
MDVQLTAVDARTGRSADVVLVIERDSTVADAARALRAALGVPAAAAEPAWSAQSAPTSGWPAGRSTPASP